MERPEGLSAKWSKGIIILFHIVGLAGFLIPATQPVFLKIVPFHLLLMLLIVFFNHKQVDGKYIGFVLLISLSGFAAEWLGVHKGLIFGNYAYGDTLGFKLMDIPLMIGVNWFLLIYAVGVTLQRLRVKSQLARIVLGALLLVFLDLQIEPVAIRFDYWHWAHQVVPLKNYLGWFMVSAALLWVFELFKFKKQSWVAPVLLGMQFVFFCVLNLL